MPDIRLKYLHDSISRGKIYIKLNRLKLKQYIKLNRLKSKYDKQMAKLNKINSEYPRN